MKRLTCFSKRDFGEIILTGLGVAEFLIAVLLCLSLKINEKTLTYGVCVCTLIFGAGYIFAYLANARTRFRPCWYLPFGILLFFIGACVVFASLLRLQLPASLGITAVVILASLFNFILTLSNSFQLKALCLKRWIPVAFFGIVNLTFAAVVYLIQDGKIKNIFSLGDKPLRCVAVFFMILAVQTVTESLYVFGKDMTKHNENLY